uniref:Cadherin n=1 Tax=Anopheles dirus TaxID=7168 RepID=A0A182N916_9DIPT
MIKMLQGTRGVNAFVQAECVCEAPPPSLTCLNGGFLVNDRCSCPEGFEGPHCEMLGIGFYGSGYALYPPISPCNMTRISVELSPHQEDGLVMYIGPLNYNPRLPIQDFLALELVKGLPVLLLDYGSGTIRIEHQYQLSKGKSFTVEIVLQPHTIEMTVDNCKLSTCMSLDAPKGPNRFLNVNAPLQLGGAAVNLDHLGSLFNWTYVPQDKVLASCINCVPSFMASNYNNSASDYNKNGEVFVKHDELYMQSHLSYKSNMSSIPLDLPFAASTQCDNRKPNIVCNSYKPMLKEEQPAGTPVIRVTATDPDPQQTIEYSFVTAPGERSRFRIDKDTGEITTAHIFDRDEPMREKEFYLIVRATDNGCPRLSDVCSFKVTIVDINDNPPVFDRVHYEVMVTGDMEANRRVGMISATDIDDGDNSIIKYEIVNRNPDSAHFKINENNGQLTLIKPVDRVPGHDYYFRVRAYNVCPPGVAIQEAEVDVKVRVIESNKLPPSFTKLPGAPIMLNETFHDYIEPLAVLEAVSNIPEKPKVIFDLMQGRLEQTNLYNTFLLEQINNTASVKLAKTLDYEMVPEYMLTVRVRNSNGVTAQTVLKIKIMDENDNIPVFAEVGLGTISENEPPRTPVIQVHAYDLDGTPANNIVSYRFADENQQFFYIDNQTGYITSLVQFDREVTDSYHLKVIAEDNSPSALRRNGQPNSISKQFIIKILDKNDHQPQFVNDHFVVENLLEDTNINTAVIEVKALDQDTASLITYSIIDGNEGDAFKIDENTGRISVNSRLDYETVREYMLFVRADDGIFQDNATVSIKIENVNDNPPRFIDLRNVTIQEETIPKGCIMTIQAYDPDIENRDEPQHIRFSFVKEQEDLLEIDDGGCLRLKSALDRDPPQGFKSWQFIITATDEDGAGMKTPATVNIFLEDINDNAPRLSNAMPVVWGENRDPGLIVRLTAEDVDEAQNGPPFHFSIDPNSSYEIKERFQVRGDELYALVEFDREEQKEYRVPILISDSGNKSMSDVSILQLVIGDDNDNEMRPGESRIFVYNYKGESPNTEVGRVYVDDPDDWDLTDKTFLWDEATRHQFVDFFDLNRDTGMIKMLQGTRGGDYELNFNVTEQSSHFARHSVAARVTVTVKEIPEEARSVAVAVSFGIDSYFLIAIVACIVVLLILLLAVVVHKKQKHYIIWHETDIDDIRGTIMEYEEEGGGEYDTKYDLAMLSIPQTHFETLYVNEECHKVRDASKKADIEKFLTNSKLAYDNATNAYSIDTVRYYAYEGDGTSLRTLSSLTSSDDDGDIQMNYLSFGPNIQELVAMLADESTTQMSDDAQLVLKNVNCE